MERYLEDVPRIFDRQSLPPGPPSKSAFIAFSRTMPLVPTTTPEVLVVGGGIAGLTAAIALDRFGMDVQVVERAAALTQAGTALSIWPNALAALDRIGLREGALSIGSFEPAPVARDASGRLLLRFHLERLGEATTSRALLVRRYELQQLLLDAASHLAIRLNTPAKRLLPGADGVEVSLAGGTSLTAGVVLGCDGIHSIARPLFANPPPAYRSRTSWRAVLEDAAHLVPASTLTVGQGNQFIAGPLRDGSVYWAADVGLSEGANAAMVDRREFLLRVFSSWHDPIPHLIERTDNDQLVIADLYDSVPRQLVSGRLALLGDAAHPMMPDLGQGACQSIEDAVVLAECLKVFPDRLEALARYESLRLRRVRSIVRGSRRLGQLATSRSRAVAMARDFAGRHLPAALNAKVVARVASEDSFLRTLPVS